MTAKEHAFTNRLIQEKSPYLQQHAHNPVDWYPWGQEAFQMARKLDKPIFLSIGYATCHWCHVMEEESFEDTQVAAILNDIFVPIKIDREELPEVDAIYMEFAQAMIVGSAGWPLNLILTPDLKPIFAATYLPKNTSHGLMGVIELSKKIQEIWQGDDRERLVSQSEKIVNILRSKVHTQGDELPQEALISTTAEILFKISDPVYGGMRGPPKFPLGYHVNFLLNYFLKTQEVRALFLVEKTLEMMYRGGIYDHIGGGFSRYSIDERWEIPHFEKMLYDNALMITAYLDAWRVTGRDFYKKVTEEIVEYVLRDMTAENGGFYSAEDADSNGVEGLFYTLRSEEVISAIGKEEGQLFCDFYSITEEGNFEGRSIPFIATPLEEFAQEHELDVAECAKKLEKARQFLFKVRAGKERPLRDEKIITCWNGMMIHAIAMAGFCFKNTRYTDAAIKAARFIRSHLWKDGVLYRRFCDAEVRYRGTLDDYAFLISGLLSLFETNCGYEWLSWAIELAEVLENEFKATNGAFFATDGQDEELLIRKCHFSDGAEPSGNAVHTENLLRLYQITNEKTYLTQAEDIMKAAKRYMDAYPLGYCYHIKVLERYYDTKKASIIIALDENNSWYDDIVDALAHKVIPHYCTIFQKKNQPYPAALKHVPDLRSLSDTTTVSVCREGVCQKPVNDKEAIIKAIQAI